MTVEEMARRVRTVLDEFGAEVLQETNVSDLTAPLGIYELLKSAYIEFARRTRCFSEELTANAVADQAVYAFSAFGSGDGNRIVDPYELYYDDQPLTYVLVGQLMDINRQWRTAASGTPLWWTREGARALRVYQAPATSGANELMVAAWVTPDVTTWAAATEPDLHETHAELLVAKAAYEFIVRSPGEANAQRAQPLVSTWGNGIMEARAEFHPTAKADVELGRTGRGGSQPRYRYPITIEGV